MLAIVGHDDGRGMNLLALHEVGKAVGAEREGRYTIVAHEGIGEYHELSGIRGVGETLRIAHHSRIEHYFSGYRMLIAKGFSVEGSPIIEDQGNVFHLF